MDGFISGVFGYEIPVVVKKEWSNYPSGDDGYNGCLFVVDMSNVERAPLRDRDTKLLTNRQNPGDDRYAAEYLTEQSWEIAQEKTHGLLTGISLDAIVLGGGRTAPAPRPKEDRCASSPSTPNYGIQIRPQRQRPLGDGTSRSPRSRSTSSSPRSSRAAMLYENEKDAAERHFNFHGITQHEDEATPVDPDYRLSLFDTDEEAVEKNWDAETKRLVEETLVRKAQTTPNAVMLVQTQAHPRALPHLRRLRRRPGRAGAHAGRAGARPGACPVLRDAASARTAPRSWRRWRRVSRPGRR